MIEKIKKWVDWKAVLFASLVSGMVFFIINSILTGSLLGDNWLFARMSAGLVSGEQALASSGTDIGVIGTGFIIHMLMSLIFTSLIAFTIHRWGILVGFIGGGVLGLSLYWINTYTFSAFFPWFFTLRSWMMMVSHIVFGALAGGIYELLEDDSFDDRYETEVA